VALGVLVGAEGVLNVFQGHHGAVAQEHGHEVEAAGPVPEFVPREVGLGGAQQAGAFLRGQAVGGRGQGAFGAGFDFHEHEGVLVLAHEVEFQAAEAQVAFEHAQALGQQVLGGGVFAQAAYVKMPGRHDWRSGLASGGRTPRKVSRCTAQGPRRLRASRCAAVP